MGRNLIVIGFDGNVSCYVVGIYYHVILGQVEKHLLPSFAIVQLDGVQTLFWLEIHSNFTRSQDETIAQKNP